VKTPQEWRDYLDTLPEPLKGPSPWKKRGVAGEDAYQLAGELTAKAMLICADEDPTLLDIPDTITDSYAHSTYDAAWKAAKARWPGLDNWLGGITGNMFGWANQLVRYIHEKPPVGNPAIVTISAAALSPERA
jgi:hypothetical protein